MDALPMADRTGAPYASTVPNVAHACGHDAHTAMLLGAASALAAAPELPVGVRLIFQAAEELMPGGAIDAISAGALLGVSRIFALHCDPRLSVGGSRSSPDRSPRLPTRSRSPCTRRAGTPRARI
jgi:amidohydrolase